MKPASPSRRRRVSPGRRYVDKHTGGRASLGRQRLRRRATLSLRCLARAVSSGGTTTPWAAS